MWSLVTPVILGLQYNTMTHWVTISSLLDAQRTFQMYSLPTGARRG